MNCRIKNNVLPTKRHREGIARWRNQFILLLMMNYRQRAPRGLCTYSQYTTLLPSFNNKVKLWSFYTSMNLFSWKHSVMFHPREQGLVFSRMCSIIPLNASLLNCCLHNRWATEAMRVSEGTHARTHACTHQHTHMELSLCYILIRIIRAIRYLRINCII